MTEHKHERVECCPSCNTELNQHANAIHGEKSTPRPGDYTVCLHCAALLRFAQSPGLRWNFARVTRRQLLQMRRSHRRPLLQAIADARHFLRFFGGLPLNGGTS
jgi:hypothetical protein